MAGLKNIAKTLFESGAKDIVKPFDPYSGNPAAKPPAPIIDKVKNVVGSAMDNVKKQSGLLGDTIKSGEIVPLILSLDKKSAKAIAKDRLKDAVGGLKSPIEDLKVSAISGMLSSMGIKSDYEIANQLPGSGNAAGREILTQHNLQVLYRGTKTIIENKDINNASDLVKVLNTITRDGELATILDLKAQFAFMDTILKNASRLGVVDAFDDIIDSIDDSKTQQLLMVENLFSYAAQGDFLTVEKIVDRIGAGQTLDRVPNIVTLLLQSYKLPIEFQPTDNSVSPPITTQGLVGQLTIITRVLNKIDPHWYQYSRNGALIIDIGAFTTMSKDAKTVLNLKEIFRVPCAIASVYTQQDIIGLGKMMYPISAL